MSSTAARSTSCRSRARASTSSSTAPASVSVLAWKSTRCSLAPSLPTPIAADRRHTECDGLPAALRSTPPVYCDADRTATIALAGDTMLGRGVADLLIRDRATPLVAPEVVDQLASADAVVLNLECCISDRGTRFPDPRKPFFFRAPPVAAERLAELGVDAVTLANNHALDYGPQALLDTLCHLERAGIAAVGAGADAMCAREPLLLAGAPVPVRVV